MKIYIITDLEGISGIDSIDMIYRENPNHSYSIKRLMLDVNAAVEGAFEGGANEVVISDGHAGGGNFKPGALHKKAVLAKCKPLQLDNSFDAVMIVGAHAMAGTMNGFLDHTQSSGEWFNYRVNGRKTGEIGQCAIMAAQYDLPVIMVTGDEAACIEAGQFLNPVECVAVKRGIGRNKAQLMVDNDEALELIRKGAKKSMELLGVAKPFKPALPLDIKLELTRSDYCDEIASRAGVERLDARTVRKVCHSYQDILF